MATVPYIAAGDDISNDRWDVLWAELDRKMGLLLDGKSPFVQFDAGNAVGFFRGTGLLGNVFYFLGPAARGGFGPDYDHAQFTAAAAALVEGERNDTWLVMRTNAAAVQLIGSLEAHKRTIEVDGEARTFWLWPENSTVPEKRYRYAVAELVFDGGLQGFDMPAAWDKYNFFRIHNLSADVALTVRFMKADGSVAFQTVVGRYGCKCVRRDPGQGSAAEAANYDASLSYFWTLRSGDPRWLQQLGGELPPGAGKEGYISMAANNVANPSLLFRWIQYYEQASPNTFGEVRWFRDPHAVYNLGTYHGKLGDAANPQTIVGDLLHHKGTMRLATTNHSVAERDIEFEGYGTLRAKLLEAGLDLVESATNVAISCPVGPAFTYLIALGTNLLQGSHLLGAGNTGPFAATTAAPLAVDFELDARYPDTLEAAFHSRPLEGGGGFRIVTPAILALDVDWQANDGSFPAGFTARALVTKLEYTLTGEGGDESPVPPAMRIWRDQLRDVCTLRNFVSETHLPLTYCALERGRFVTTIFGPELHYDLKVLLAGRCSDANLRDGVLNDPLTTFAGGYATQKRVIKWPAVGWATPENPGFFTPRLTRRYSQRPDVDIQYWRHPDIINEEAGPDGADFDLESVGESYEASDVSALCPAFQERAGISRDNFGVWTNPDALREASRSFPFQVAPFDRWMPRVFLLEEIYNTMAAWVNGLLKAKPITFENSRFYIAPSPPPLGDTYPIDLYLAMPDRHPTLNSAFAGEPSFTGRNRGYTALFEPDSTSGQVTTWEDHGRIAAVIVAPGVAPLRSGWYLKIRTVQSYAEGKGFKFKFEMVSRPIGFDLMEATMGAATLKEGSPIGALFNGQINTYALLHSEADNLQWKAPAPSGTMKSDAKAGNKIYDGQVFPDGNAYKQEVTVDQKVADSFVGQTIAAPVWGPKRILVDNYVSDGLTVETIAIMTPEQTFRHVGSDYSGEDWANFIGAANYKAAVLPMETQGEAGPATIRQCGFDQTVVGVPHSAAEIVVRFMTVVHL